MLNFDAVASTGNMIAENAVLNLRNFALVAGIVVLIFFYKWYKKKNM